MKRPYEPLSNEERQLASRLEKLGPRGEPSPALDARILAAAHTAVAANPVARRKPRWPVAMGLAASAVLAVGLAWQLRPLQEHAFERQAPTAVPPAPAPTPAPVTAIEEHETASAIAGEMTADAAIAPTEVSEPATGASAPLSALPPAAPAQSRPERARTAPAATRRQASPATAPAIPQATESAREMDTYTPSMPPAPAAAAPPPPPPPIHVSAPAPQSTSVADSEAAMKFTADPEEVVVTGSRVTTTHEAAARTQASKQAQAEQQARRTPVIRRLTGAPASATPALDSIPVAQDAILPAEDWLQRIRERRDNGTLQHARDSLSTFVQTHPEYPLPDDLKPLLDPP